MENYIEVKGTEKIMHLTEAATEKLSQLAPHGCTCEEYTLLDVLKELFSKYNQKVKEEMPVYNFINYLILDNILYANLYGRIIREFCKEV